MSTSDLVLFLHVLAAATWFGAAMMSMLLFELAIRSGDRSWLLQLMEHEDVLATRMFVPAALTTVASGIAMVVTGPYTFSQGWVIGGLAGFVLIFAVGITVFLPAGARVRAAVAEHGIDSDQVRDRLEFVRKVARVDTPALAIVIFLMTTKPF